MDEELYKICSDCGEEYSLEALSCVECGGRLVFPSEYKKREVPLEEDEAEVLVRQGGVGYLKELGGLLQKKGIRNTIRFHGCAPGT